MEGINEEMRKEREEEGGKIVRERTMEKKHSGRL